MDVCSYTAENLITMLQARDGLSILSQSSPLRGPECCSYNSHGSSIQESPSEREPQIYSMQFCSVSSCCPHTFILLNLADVSEPYCIICAGYDNHYLPFFFSCFYSRLSEHAQYELHLAWIRQWGDRTGRCGVELCCWAEKRRLQRHIVKGSTTVVP